MQTSMLSKAPASSRLAAHNSASVFKALPVVRPRVTRASTTVRAQAADVDADSSRRTLLKNVMGAAAALLPAAAAKAEDANAVASSRMSYSRFLEYLDMGRVKKVDLYENGTIAIVEAVSPELGNRVQRVRVQLPGTSSELLQKFREKKIDFAAHSNTEDGGAVFLNLLGNLAFPLLLVGGLFLLSRRSQGGMGGGPGGNNPLAFGKSKAKFQMEPDTGVTFGDVAGVDEAKQDFQEIVEFLKKPEKFTAVGARIPKGCLLVGPPGECCTTRARAAWDSCHAACAVFALHLPQRNLVLRAVMTSALSYCVLDSIFALRGWIVHQMPGCLSMSGGRGIGTPNLLAASHHLHSARALS